MNFEWDEDKRLANIARHGIDFAIAVSLFDGRSLLTFPGAFRDELRYMSVGMLNGKFITAVWTQRDEAIRLISVRASRHGEKRDYHAHHSG